MKRIIFWCFSILVALVLIVALAFRLSPWPSAWLIATMFSKNDAASEIALEKYVPDGIAAEHDLAYGDGPDETFDLYRPGEPSSPLPAIVWVHGGGFIGGSKGGVANYMKILAGHGYTTIAVEYSKGFGSSYPKPVEQVNAALGYLTEKGPGLGIDPSRIIIAGDSAGAQIASQVALLTTDRTYAAKMGIAPALEANQLFATLLLSGTYDLNAVNLGGDYAWFLKTVLWAYSGVKDFMKDERFRLISVTQFVTASFPPSFISSGNGDPLAPQAIALSQKLEGLGVTTDTLFFPPDREPPLPHEYQFGLDDPAGQEALKRMLAFLTRLREQSDTGR